MGMKTSGWIATAAAGVVLVGGGAWAATTLPASDEGTVAAIEDTQAPAASAEPVETVEPVETPEVTDTTAPTSAPVTVEPQPTTEPLSPEDEYLRASGEIVRGFGYEITDDELMAAGEYSCEVVAETQNLSGHAPIDGITESMNNGVVYEAVHYLCPSALS